MQIIKIQLNLEVFERLFKSGQITSDDYQLIAIDDKDFDYSSYPEWEIAKDESTKAYKKLKEIEYNIRHNKK